MPYVISSKTFGKLQKLLKQDTNEEARTVVFFEYGDFKGHFIPTLEFARLFASKGHTVHFFASEMVKAEVEESGAIFQPYDLSLSILNNSTADPKQWTLRLEALRQLEKMGYDEPANMKDQPFVSFLPAALGLLERGLIDRVRSLQPDVIVAEMMIPWGPMVSEVLDIPLLSLVASTYMPMDRLPDVMGLRGLMDQDINEDYMKAVAAKLVTKYGLINYSGANLYDHLSEFQIAWTIPEFDVEAAIAMNNSPYMKCYGSSMPPLQADDDNIIQEGLKDFPIEELKQLKAQGKTILYCSMGSVVGQFSFTSSILPVIQSVVSAYDEDPNTIVVLSVGPKIDLEPLPQMPSNFFVRRSVPQKTILGIADVFISHMGNNSTNEAIFMGCPMVSIPNYGDQNINAKRASEVGIAVHIPSPSAPKPAEDLKYVTPQVIKRAVNEVLTKPSYKAAAAHMRDIARKRRRRFENEAMNEIFDYVEEYNKRSSAKEASRVLRVTSCSQPIRAKHIGSNLHKANLAEQNFSRIASH